MNEFKAGDLALIIRDEDSYNLGKVVELIEHVPDCGQYSVPIHEFNILNNSGSDVWVVSGDVLDEEGCNGFTQKSPRNLMPLKGDFEPAKDKAEEMA